MNHRKLFAAMTAACLLLSGCQKNPVPDAQPEDPLTAQELAQTESTPPAEDTTPLTSIVRCDPITLPDQISYIIQPTLTPDGIRGIAYTKTMQDSYLHISPDLQTTDIAILTPPAEDGDFFLSERRYTLDDDGIWALAVMESHGGMAPCDAETDSRTYDWDAWNSACEYRYLLCRYAENGALISAIPVDGLAEYQQHQDNYTYNSFLYFTCAGGNLYLTLNNTIVLQIDKETGELRKYFEAAKEADYCSTNIIDSDSSGKPLHYRTGTDSLDDLYRATSITTRICEFDPATGEDGKELYYSHQDSTDFPGFVNGFGKYRFCLNTPSQLIGVQDDGSQEVLIDWDASDLFNMTVFPISETQFFAYGYNYNGDLEAYRLSRKHESENRETEVLKLGIFGNSKDDTSLYSFVKQFNRTHDGYRIEFEEHTYETSDDYDVTNANIEKAWDDFKLSLLTGNAPDLVLLYNHSDLTTLGKRGAFTDLNTFMSGDALFNQNTLVPNVIQALETPEGALYGLPTLFSVETITAKTNICNKENWTLDDMIKLYDSADHDVYRWQTNEEVFTALFHGISFADGQNGTSRFDTPELIKILEFANRFPTSIDRPYKDYESPAAMEKLDKFYTDQFLSFSRDEQYLCPTTLYGGGNMAACAYSYAKYHTFGGDEITFVGYPSDNGQGGKISPGQEIAVTSRCKHPQLAWEFVKSFIQRTDTDQSGLSILDEHFEQELDQCMHVSVFTGEEEQPYYEDDGMKVYPMTQAERERVECYIRSCTTLMPADNDTVLGIALEEAEKYFAGDQSAEEAAKTIQSRVSLMLAEQN